jgi:hypothetical protein
MNCAAQKGFLTLGACDSPAVSSCGTCGQPMCSVHLSAQSGFTTCLSCSAADPNVQEGEGEAEYDGVWRQRYRSSYYDDTGYSPVRHSFNNQDSASFRDRGQNDLAEDETDRGGFGES